MKKTKSGASHGKGKARGQTRRSNQTLPLLLMLAGGLALMIAAVVFFSVGVSQGSIVAPARVGSELSNFELMNLEGQKVKLSDYRGQVVLVNAWATWCPPCRAEMPDLNAYYQQHAADGFVILAVNAGDEASLAVDFAKEYGLAFPVLLDPQIDLLNSLNIRSFPTSIIVGRDGVIKDIHIGMLSPEQIEAKVGPLLSQ